MHANMLIYPLIPLGFFCCGVVWAPIFTGAASIKEGLESASYLATIAACVAAIIALRGWRAQFRYGKKFECLSALKLASDNIRSATKHGRLFTRNQMRVQGLVNGSFPALESRAAEAEAAWSNADQEMLKATDECELFLSGKFYRQIFLLHEQLSRLVREYECNFFLLLESNAVSVQEIHSSERAFSKESDRIISEIQTTVREMRLKEFPVSP